MFLKREWKTVLWKLLTVFSKKWRRWVISFKHPTQRVTSFKWRSLAPPKESSGGVRLQTSPGHRSGRFRMGPFRNGSARARLTPPPPYALWDRNSQRKPCLPVLDRWLDFTVLAGCAAMHPCQTEQPIFKVKGLPMWALKVGRFLTEQMASGNGL